jgi:hypothetical protein
MGATFSSARLGRITILFALCFFLTGCAKSKITKANFDKIEKDMTLDQVEAILGDGQPQGDGSLVGAQAGIDVNAGGRSPSTTDYVWESGNNKITVTFRGGKVMGKSSSGF